MATEPGRGAAPAPAPEPSAPSPSPSLRPVARWVRTVDERGRSHLVMQWDEPDPDAALRALTASA